MSQSEYIERLEVIWDVDGFMGRLRDGHFDSESGREFLEFLRDMKFEEGCFLQKRLVELIWYIPLFLHWQVERIAEADDAISIEYLNFCGSVVAALELTIGAP